MPGSVGDFQIAQERQVENEPAVDLLQESITNLKKLQAKLKAIEIEKTRKEEEKERRRSCQEAIIQLSEYRSTQRFLHDSSVQHTPTASQLMPTASQPTLSASQPATAALHATTFVPKLAPSLPQPATSLPQAATSSSQAAASLPQTTTAVSRPTTSVLQPATSVQPPQDGPRKELLHKISREQSAAQISEYRAVQRFLNDSSVSVPTPSASRPAATSVLRPTSPASQPTPSLPRPTPFGSRLDTFVSQPSMPFQPTPESFRLGTQAIRSISDILNSSRRHSLETNNRPWPVWRGNELGDPILIRTLLRHAVAVPRRSPSVSDDDDIPSTSGNRINTNNIKEEPITSEDNDDSDDNSDDGNDSEDSDYKESAPKRKRAPNKGSSKKRPSVTKAKGDNSKPAMTRDPYRSESKLISCKICSRIFTSQGGYNNHATRIHNLPKDRRINTTQGGSHGRESKPPRPPRRAASSTAKRRINVTHTINNVLNYNLFTSH